MPRSFALQRMLQLFRFAQIAHKHHLSLEQLLERKESFNYNRTLSRREMLKVAGSAAALLPLTDLISQQAIAEVTRSPMSNQEPVAIIGAGLAGLTAAYRLQKASVPCVLYEMGSRLGGRVFTKKNFNTEGMFCELGGELVDQRHTDLFELCTELNVGLQDLRPGDYGLSNQLYAVNGKVITEKQMLQAFIPLAAQVSKDINKIFGEGGARIPTFRDQSNTTLVKYDKMTLTEYLYSKMDVDKWALDLIQVLYVCEFGLDADEQSALNFLTLISTNIAELHLLGESDENFRIAGGSSSLVNSLAKAIETRVPIHHGHELVKIQERGKKIKLTFLNGSNSSEIFAERVVCTIPFSVLSKVEGISKLMISSRLKDCIKDLGYGTNSKLMMGFKERPWRNDSNNPSNGMVVTSTEQQFWETSRMQKGKAGILTNFLGGKMGLKIPRGKTENNLQILDEIFSGTKNQYDQHQVLQYWPNYPGAMGSYICFKPGQYTSMHGLATEPVLSGKLIFAGEHTSVEQCGFMNGAVESGNRASRIILNQLGRNPARKASTGRREFVQSMLGR